MIRTVSGAGNGAGNGPAVKGLNPDGTIAREGTPDRVQEAFAPVVEAARRQILAAFGDPALPSSRLRAAYVYGSIPRGTARHGHSDLDLLLALRGAPTPADRAAADAMGASLDAEFAQIDGVGTLLYDAEVLLSELERHDLGFFVACLCTPLLGEDLADDLPAYRPDALLARETNGDLALLIPRWRSRLAAATSDADLLRLSRGVGRHLTRTAFTLVMPRWGGWTSDLAESAAVFAHYYPDDLYPSRAAQIATAATVGRTPTTDRAVLTTLLDDLSPWLATEYTRLHGTKAPRPQP